MNAPTEQATWVAPRHNVLLFFPPSDVITTRGGGMHVINKNRRFLRTPFDYRYQWRREEEKWVWNRELLLLLLLPTIIHARWKYSLLVRNHATLLSCATRLIGRREAGGKCNAVNAEFLDLVAFRGLLWWMISLYLAVGMKCTHNSFW